MIVILNVVKNLYSLSTDIRDVSASLNMTFLNISLCFVLVLTSPYRRRTAEKDLMNCNFFFISFENFLTIGLCSPSVATELTLSFYLPSPFLLPLKGRKKGEGRLRGKGKERGAEYDAECTKIQSLFLPTIYSKLPFHVDGGEALFCYHLAVQEVDGALGKTGIALRVSDHDDGGAEGLVEFGEELHHLQTNLGVEVTRWLVGQDEFGVSDYGAGNGDALLLTARELLGEVVSAVADGHAAQHLFDALLALLLGDAQIGERQFDVLFDVEFVQEVEALEDEANLTFAHLGTLALFEAADFLSVQPILAAGGVVEQTQDVEQGGLAATRGTHDGNKLALFHFERHAAQGSGFNFFGTEHFC